ncbi:equilibrative nucleoside transporter 2 [Scaptodrosophila lebanonensis]|uniref:Equilibrative nucleoside transporter 2 n=1 Tax=Drosophila lebanonensis TaxID=7225 RepID=A0A6J2U721_DROLE|nr:equilibrative nucleoside transporter 2 [Scaptodrosophila lebanonensis]
MNQNDDDRQQLLNDNDDDEILGGGGCGFVAAVMPSDGEYEDRSDCLNHLPELCAEEPDQKIQLTYAPAEGATFIFFVFYLLGIGTMTPWNFFVTAEDYWKYKFRNTTLNETDTLDELTPLQKSFTCDLTLTATISGTTFLILNAVYGKHVSLGVKLLGTLTAILVLFGITTAFVEINTDNWQEQFFLITLIIVVILNISAATMSGGLYGIAGLFPSEYMTAVVSGQALGGIITALAFILVLALDTEPKTTAFIFFILGIVLISFCIVCYIIMVRQPYFNYYLNGGDQYKIIKAAPSHSREEDIGVPLEPIMSHVLGKIFMQTITLALLYATTLSVYPAVTILMQSEHYGSKSAWSDIYYMPVVNYLFFNCGDYFGRLLAGWWDKPTNRHTTFLFTIVRVLFVPFFLCSNSSEHYFLPILIKHDAAFISMMIVFGLSNGYLTNNLLIMVPRRVKQHEKELASSIMAASLSCGMVLGSLLSMAFVQML